MNVLVVDDDETVRATIIEILALAGHNVIQASGGAEALKLLENNPVDFVISDWNMPGMSGVDFLKVVRANEKTKDLPFVICTSPGTDEVLKIEAAVGAKVDSYVIKPFRADTLQSKINEVLSKKTVASQTAQGVLVVDDDDQVRKIIVEILELQGRAPVFEAHEGDEGFQVLEKNASQIGLVISDWEMPKMAGIVFLKKIRNDPRFARLPFLMVTSQTSIEHIKLKDAINAQVSHYLMKPFSSKDLQEKIDLVLKRSQSEREVEFQLSHAKQLSESGRLSEAREIYKSVIRKDSKNIAAHLELAETYLRDEAENAFDEGVILIKRVIQMRPDLDTGYIALALAFEHAKSLDKAVQILQDAVSQASEGASENIQYHLGRLHLRLGRADLALDSLNQALKIRPSFPEAQQLLKQAAGKAK